MASLRGSQWYFLLALLGVSFLLTLVIFRPFLSALALALVFGVVLYPLHREIHAQMPKWPGVASLFTVAVGIVGIILPLFVIGILLVREAESLYGALSHGGLEWYLYTPLEVIERWRALYAPWMAPVDIAALNVDAYFKNALAWIIGNLGLAVSRVAGIFIGFLVFFFSLFYLLRDGEALHAAVLRLSPLGAVQTTRVLDRMALAVNSVIKGNLTIALVQGILTSIGLTIFGIPNSILWGTIAATGALIPGVGTSIVFVPSVAYLFLVGHLWPALGLTLWGAYAVGLVDNFLGPRLIGDRLHLHPIFVLLAVLGGILLFGPVGIFLGPISVSLFFTLLAMYAEHAQSSSHTS